MDVPSSDSDSMEVPSSDSEPMDGEPEDSFQSTLSFQLVEGVTLSEAIDEAIAYLKSVKDVFGANSEEYIEFVRLVKDYATDRISFTGVISRVKVLLKDHPELLVGFNTFLPTGYEISVQLSEESPMEVAVNFINKLRIEFRHDEGRYASFLKFMEDCRRNTRTKSIEEMHLELHILFHDRPDLLEEALPFFNFKTSTSQIADSNRKQNKRSRKMNKSFTLLCLCTFFLALSVLVAFGMGIRLGHYFP